jgi:hypothetical protein
MTSAARGRIVVYVLRKCDRIDQEACHHKKIGMKSFAEELNFSLAGLS